jgi:hypothetical protein
VIAADLLGLRADGEPGSAGSRVEEWIRGFLTKRLANNNTGEPITFRPFDSGSYPAFEAGHRAVLRAASYLKYLSRASGDVVPSRSGRRDRPTRQRRLWHPLPVEAAGRARANGRMDRLEPRRDRPRLTAGNPHHRGVGAPPVRAYHRAMTGLRAADPIAPADAMIRAGLERLRGDPARLPDASIVVPVNAQGDLGNVRRLLGDLGAYDGARTFEVVLVVNNYPPEAPPAEIDVLRELGAKVVAVPSVRRPGEPASFTARIPGLRAASSERVMSFDADCRIPRATALLDWYVAQLDGGAKAAYTPVGYHELRRRSSVFARIATHHAARWVKRVLLRVPTTRGSNYAVDRDTMLGLYSDGFLADDMNVGPAVKGAGGRVAYSGARSLKVLTSGRMFRGGWRKLARYLFYRLRYNLRVVPVRRDVAKRTGRERDPVRVYRDNRPVR